MSLISNVHHNSGGISLGFVSLSPLTLALVAIVFALFAFKGFRRTQPLNAPPLLKDHLPIVGATAFFRTRWDFFQQAGQLARAGAFSFFLGKHHVVGLRGPQNRALFFESRDLDAGAGYAVLFGQGATVAQGGGTNFGSQFGQFFVDRIGELLQRDNMERALSDMIKDVRRLVAGLNLSASTRTDPFDSLYKLIFRLTMRVVGSKDIADDDAMLASALKSYQVLEHQSTDALSIAVPWLPTPTRVQLFYHGARIHGLLSRLARDRKTSGVRVDDALQHLIDRGDSEVTITAFLLSAIFAGQANTGASVGYLLLHLAQQPSWLTAVRDELRSALSQSTAASDASVQDRLAGLPLNAWEMSLPVLDACLRETIRVHLMASGFRANLTPNAIPLPDGSGSIPSGSFATTHFGEPHRNPAIWPNAEKWDPARFLRGDDEKRPGKHDFVGWGSGRHPCLGKRTAKIEVCITVAFFVASFDFEIADGKGIPSGRADSAGIMKPVGNVELEYRPREKGL